MSDTYSYEVLEPGGHARLVGNVLDRISRASANSASAVGSATGILGDPETASWMERTTAADGAALIESIKGNTLRWNQLVNPNVGTRTSQSVGITLTVTADGLVSYTGTTQSTGGRDQAVSKSFDVVSGHKYLIRDTINYPSNGNGVWHFTNVSTNTVITGNGVVGNSVYTAEASARVFLGRNFTSTGVEYDCSGYVSVYDLTQMFGSGNEPATVAEFEALFPEPYYPYDAGSLLPVRMEGIETVGFNQWDEDWDNGDIDTSTGQNTTGTTVRSKGYVPVIPGLTYYFKCPTGSMFLWAYGADKSYLSRLGPSGLGNVYSVADATVTIPPSVRFVRFRLATTYGTAYTNDICINISDPARNGEYEPYWRSERAIPATDLRSAGSVYDELREGERITRVGAVDLGTLDWVTYSSPDSHIWRAVTYQFPAPPKEKDGGATPVNAEIAKYTVKGYSPLSASDDKCFGIGNDRISIIDSAYSTAAAFKAAMSGVMLYYELATPTTTPIDPPLPLSYRTGAGGTERVMVASGTMSAPPIFATRYPLDPTDLAASIAPVDGPIAKTNHQVGDLLMLGFTLCKATQVIVTGETIAIGTNVTRTTVAAELAALSE